jgi:hypothetical protein
LLTKFKYLITGRKELVDLVESRIGKSYIIITSNAEKEINNRVFEWNTLIYCEYPEVNWCELPPVDSPLLNSMANCERTFLKMVERNFPGSTYQIRKDYYLRHLRYWNWNLSTDLKYAFFSNVPHEGFDYLIYCLCKLKNIQTLCFYTLPIRPNKSVLMHAISDIYNPSKEIEVTYLNLLKNDNCSQESVADDLPKYLSNYLFEQENKIEELISFTRAEKNRIKTHNFSKLIILFKRLFVLLVSLKFKKIFRSSINRLYRDSYYEKEVDVEKFYSKNTSPPDLKKTYIYFPLHFQPECSTSPLGGDFVDQGLVCEMLSWAAGKEIMIYVKEHPRRSKVDYIRNIAFYKRILSCKNTVLLNRNTDSYQLIDNSFAVAAVTGSAGWEAFLRRKPVLMFGSRFYENAPGNFKIRSNNDLSKALDIIKNKSMILERSEVIKYLKALESHVFEGFIADCDESVATVSRSVSDRNVCEQIIKFISLN